MNISHSEVIEQISDALRGVDDSSLVQIYNQFCDDRIAYIGDSLFEVCESTESTESANRRVRDLREQAADAAFESCEFPLNVVGLSYSGWITVCDDGCVTLKKLVFVKLEDDAPGADARKISFNVKFKPDSTSVDEAFAWWLGSHEEVLCAWGDPDIEYLTNACGELTYHGFREPTDAQLALVPFEQGPGAVTLYMVEQRSKVFILANLEVAHQDPVWDEHSGDYWTLQEARSYCDRATLFLRDRLMDGAFLLPLSHGDPGRLTIGLMLPIDSPVSAEQTMQIFSRILGPLAQMEPNFDGKAPQAVSTLNHNESTQ